VAERAPHHVRRAWAALLATCALAGAAPSLARDRLPGALESCANDRLPREIVDGAPERARTPLALVDAVAPFATLRLAVADDLPTREAGLMCVMRLRPQHGMVFVFSRDSDWEFWMKNTLISLDMIWIRADGTVTSVATGVPSSTRTTPDAAVARRRGRGAYVVELLAGEAAADGIVAGTHLTLPALRTAR